MQQLESNETLHAHVHSRQMVVGREPTLKGVLYPLKTSWSTLPSTVINSVLSPEKVTFPGKEVWEVSWNSNALGDISHNDQQPKAVITSSSIHQEIQAPVSGIS